MIKLPDGRRIYTAHELAQPRAPGATSEMADHLDQLTVALDPVVEILNGIPDDADYRGKTWEAIQRLREACTWLGVERLNQ